MRFRYKDTKEEFIPHKNEVLTLNDDGTVTVSKPYINGVCYTSYVSEDLEVWEDK